MKFIIPIKLELQTEELEVLAGIGNKEMEVDLELVKKFAFSGLIQFENPYGEWIIVPNMKVKLTQLGKRVLAEYTDLKKFGRDGHIRDLTQKRLTSRR